MDKIPDKGDLKYFVSWDRKLIIYILKKEGKEKQKAKAAGRKNNENWAALYILTCIFPMSVTLGVS